jgi:glycosyltransferase involved in cell wall biosynthesis
MNRMEPTLPLPLVSIVINSFNQAAFLEETIQSVLKQEYSNMEILLVDGGSTDGSLDIIKKYAGRFKWWVSEPDHGQADGINKGLSHAKGDLVAWLNSDDQYLPGVVAEVVRTWQDRPDVSLIYGDVVAIDENGRPLNRIKCGAYQLADLMTFKIINQPAVFMNRSVLKIAGYLNTSYHYLLDHHLWLRCAAVYDTIYVKKVWAKARFHSQAKNLADADKFGEEAYRIVEWCSKDKRTRDMFPLISNQVWAGADRINARYLLDAGEPRQALSSYWRGLNRSPRIVLPEWHRMVYCLLAMIGLARLKDAYLAIRRVVRPINMDSTGKGK